MSLLGVEIRAPSARSKLWPGLIELHEQIIVGLDVCAGLLTGYVSSYFYGILAARRSLLNVSWDPEFRAILASSIITALVLRGSLLTREGPRNLRDVLAGRAVCAVALLLCIGLATRAVDDMARLWVFGWASAFCVWVVTSRLTLLFWFRRLIGRGLLREAVAVVGGADSAARLAARIAGDVDVIAILERHGGAAEHDNPDGLDDVLDLARAGMIDTVVVTMDRSQPLDVRAIVEHLKSIPVQIALCPDLAGLHPSSRELRMLSGVPMAIMSDRPIRRFDLVLKGACDRLGAICALLLLSPLLVACALAVALESPGPILFRQRRTGWAGRLFTVYKFRTMHEATSARAEDGISGRQAERHDRRCTRIGSFLRRTSLDELPQLWNVLIGEMSLVGPRPHADAMHARERAGWSIVAAYAHRQRVKPGMTGWAQVNGLRGGISRPDQLRLRVEHDLYYIDHWSLLFDLKILLRTPLSMLFGENAF